MLLPGTLATLLLLPLQAPRSVVAEVDALLKIRPRLSFYSSEETAELVVDLDQNLPLQGASLEVEVADLKLERAADAQRVMVELPVARLPEGTSPVTCRLLQGGRELGVAATQIARYPPKPNEVKIDCLRRGLLVDGLPYFPFGFYCYWPINRVLDEEVVNGFNLLSPYQGGPHSEEEFARIQAYLDRAAAIGMRVNYQVMWPLWREWNQATQAELRAEIERFRDHPAVLSWYTADEPGGERVEHLGQIYRFIKELDPYHPITIVFYQGGEHARQFVDVLDIVMADPYPIPNGPVRTVADMADAVNQALDYSKPLWIVPQAFGGGEGWHREPTAREQRAMTCLALIHGATGIKYFIRAPRVSFPKSPIMWGECSRLALETAELAPALLSAEPRPQVTAFPASVHAAAWRDRGMITVLAVNSENTPQSMRLQLPGVDYTGEAQVLFEDRKVAVQSGLIEEFIDGFGSRAYAIPVGPLPGDDLQIDPSNLTTDPSYEDSPSPGTPEGYYATIGDGATAFVDSRTARHGRRSLRLTAPTAEQVPSLSAFPFPLKAGATYRVSVWAKARTAGVVLKLSSAALGAREFSLTKEWQEYSFTGVPGQDYGRENLSLSLASAGTAWVDLLQVVPEKQ